MSSLRMLSELYRHMEWADSKMWEAVRNAPTAQQDDRIRGLLYHSHLVQRTFLQLWRGAPLQHRRIEEFAALADLETWAHTYHAEVGVELETLSDEELGRILRLPWADLLAERMGRPPAETTLGDTILQVASHSTYHRGQINARLRELGAEPPLVDYISWVWFGRPAPVWSGSQV